MSERVTVIRRELRVHPNGVQRLEQALHVHLHHLVPDQAALASSCEVEMCCHACHKAALVRFTMSTITVQPTPLRKRELDMIRDEFVKRHAQCTPDERVDYMRACPESRDGDHVLYDLSVDAS